MKITDGRHAHDHRNVHGPRVRCAQMLASNSIQGVAELFSFGGARLVGELRVPTTVADVDGS